MSLFLCGYSLLAQNNDTVNIFQKVLFDCLWQRGEKLDAHPRFLKTTFFPGPDNECGNLHIKMVLNRKYKIHMSTNGRRRICIDEHTIHGDILAAGNHVIPGMDIIYSEINR